MLPASGFGKGSGMERESQKELMRKAGGGSRICKGGGGGGGGGGGAGGVWPLPREALSVVLSVVILI